MSLVDVSAQPGEMRQVVNGQTLHMATGRSFRLLGPRTQQDAEAEPALTEPTAAEYLPTQTADQLHTLLVVCRNLVGASAAEISVQTAGGWLTLVRSVVRAAPSEPGTGNERKRTATGGVDGKHYGLRLQSTPVLVLALVVHRAVSPETARLLRKTLELAPPILRAGDLTEREEQTRRRVLNVQAELAHELRTPLTAISGFAQLLQRPGQLDEERRRSYAGIAVSESQQASAIIDHLVAQLQEEVEALGSEEEYAGPDVEPSGEPSPSLPGVAGRAAALVTVAALSSSG
jgi:signal transduction histidine kinase